VLEVDEENNLQFLEITDNSFEFKTQGLKSLASLIKHISKQNKQFSFGMQRSQVSYKNM